MAWLPGTSGQRSCCASAEFSGFPGRRNGRAGVITPVPGGVGPVTIAMLMHNTLRAALLKTARKPSY
jgi:5,10-methylene-tetrahydrofolate dehydrogenase/methenyl tetrahydrofolate cyclohydrolase